MGVVHRHFNARFFREELPQVQGGLEVKAPDLFLASFLKGSRQPPEANTPAVSGEGHFSKVSKLGIDLTAGSPAALVIKVRYP